MKQTKIVATIGPASESSETLQKMVEAGLNVVRLNFSHGEYKWHKMVIDRVRHLSKEMNVSIAILADIQGPRIRTEIVEPIEVHTGTHIRISDVAKRAFLPEEENIQTVLFDMPNIIDGVDEGHNILIEDGTVELVVKEKKDHFILAEAKNDGMIKNRKGVTLPDSHLVLDILTEKDKKDLHFVVEEEVDFIGLSFVGTAKDIDFVRMTMKEMFPEKTYFPKLVSKIERKLAVENLSSLVQASDAVMVARGDLGVEMPESEVVLLQKHIIAESLKSAKPVIVATQMLKSMTENPRPTRAEVSDVSNAVIDHADAVMLSEESAMGKYPVPAVAMLAEIAEKTEESPFDDLYKSLDINFRSETAVMMRSVYELAESFQAQAIVILSIGGHSARLISHFRPERKILVATPNPHTYNELALVWGVEPYLVPENQSHQVSIENLIDQAKEKKALISGDQVVIFHGRTPDVDTMKLVGIKEIR